MLAFGLPLLARALPEALVPTLFRFVYTVDELVLLVILLAGAAAGAIRRFPQWSYTWVVLAVVSIVAFLTSFLPTLLFDIVDFRFTTMGWILYATHLSGGLMILAFAASLATRGLRHALFVAAIYLAARVASPFIREATFGLSSIEIALTNTATILLAVILLAIVVAMIMQFIYGGADAQRRSVYTLLVVPLLHPILTGWIFVPWSSQGDIANALGIWGLQVLVGWAYVGAVLLIAYALILLFAWFRKIRPSTPVPSGGADG